MTIYVCSSLASAEALKVILTHEKIDFVSGVGAGSKVCIEVSELDSVKVVKHLNEWQVALNQLLASV